MGDKGKEDVGVVWKGRPSIGVYTALYGVVALVVLGILVVLELYVGQKVSSISSAFNGTLKAGPVDIPYAVELITALVIALLFVIKAVRLVIMRESNSYELRTDGMYVNKGIANLSNTFISAMAFSDARLIRTLGMRIVGLGKIVVEANDGRRFELHMIKDSARVQALIRSNLAHPTVRVEK